MSILLVKTDLSFTFDNGVVDDVPDQILGSGELSNEFPDLKNPYLESRIIKIGQETPEIAIGDNMPILEFQTSTSVLRWSRAHKRRLFLKFFISMKKNPSQGQKKILFKFEQ